MTEIYVRKLYDTFAPADQAQAEVMECFRPNGVYKAILTQPRHPMFHRKAFALTKIGYQAWEPPESREHKGRPIAKNFDSFRDDMTIRAGYFTQTWTLSGKLRLVPDSWSWGKTDQVKFEQMYSAFIDVILRDVLSNYSKDDLEHQVEQILRFG